MISPYQVIRNANRVISAGGNDIMPPILSLAKQGEQLSLSMISSKSPIESLGIKYQQVSHMLKRTQPITCARDIYMHPTTTINVFSA